MRDLIEAAAARNLTIEAAVLPEGERSRYIPSQGRILVSEGLAWPETLEAVTVLMVHAANGDTEHTPENRARAIATASIGIVRHAAGKPAHARAAAAWSLQARQVHTTQRAMVRWAAPVTAATS